MVQPEPNLTARKKFVLWLRPTRRWWWVAYACLLGASTLFQRHAELEPESSESPQSESSSFRNSTWVNVANANPARPSVATRVSGLVWPERAARNKIWAVQNADTADTLAGLYAAKDSGRWVVLLHGSPRDSTDFNTLSEILSKRGYWVFAPDAPGFGQSEHDLADYSIRAQAVSIVSALALSSISRFHLVGWSMGGGVALNIIDLLGPSAKSRVASLTLMASLNLQEAEGSCSYAFEHYKYAVGYAALVVAPELVPHFGLLGSRSARNSFIRNFWDTDQRSLRAIMEHLRVPTMVLHGRNDVFVSSWSAELCHQIILTSRLVMLDANHFLPLAQAEQSADVLTEHFARHDKPGVKPRTDIIDFSTDDGGASFLDRFIHRAKNFCRATQWPTQLALIALAILVIGPTWTVLLTGLLIAGRTLDLFVVLNGLALGFVMQGAALAIIARVFGPNAYRWPIVGKRLPKASTIDWARRLSTHPIRTGFAGQFLPHRRSATWWAVGQIAASTAHEANNSPRKTPGRTPGHTPGHTPGDSSRDQSQLRRLTTLTVIFFRLIAIALWSLASLLLAIALSNWVLNVGNSHGTILQILAFALAAFVLELLPTLLARSGRRRLLAFITRLYRHEFWPANFFYLPLYAYLLRLSAKHGGVMTPSHCNPGIEAGGGLIGESKSRIMHGLNTGADHAVREAVLPTFLIEPGDLLQRMAAVRNLLEQHVATLSFPFIIKPNEGQRGFGVKLIDSFDELTTYFEQMRRPCVVQPYHAGPNECGVLWVRTLQASPQNEPQLDGSTTKTKAGRIFSITRKTFPTITGDGQHTLEELIESHPRYRCQADIFLTRFADETTRVLAPKEVVRLAVSGNHCQGTLFADGADLITPELETAINSLAANFPGGLDFGRFDIRYTTDHQLRLGRGFAIVELNGTFSESTNLYDPKRSLFWAYGVLFAQWRTVYELGEWRRNQGTPGLSAVQLIRTTLAHFKHRDGPAIAD